METRAKLRYLRISPKKVRLVIDLIRGLKVAEAKTQLSLLNKAASKPVLKLLNSAIANSVNNFKLQEDNLYIKEIATNSAGMLKRWQPRAHGRATPLRKRMSHITIVLAELVPTAKKDIKAKKVKPVADKTVRISSKEEIKEMGKPAQEIKPEKSAKKAPANTNEHGNELKDVRMEGKHRHSQNQDGKAKKGDKGFIKKIFNRKAG